MAYLKKYWSKYNRLFFASILCVTCEAACDLLQPRFMSRLIDDGAARGDLGYVVNTGLIMLGIAGAGAVFAMVRNISASLASQRFGADIRHDMFVKIQNMSVESMDRFEGGSLVTRMTNDITQLQNFANGMMRIFFKAPIMCIGAVIMASSLNIRTAPIIAPILFAVAVIITVGMRITFPRFTKVQQALDKLNTTMREYLAGIRLVKAFRRFDCEERRFSEANDMLADSTIRAVRVMAVYSPMIMVCVNFGVAAVIFFGARRVDAGTMQVGQIMAFITYMTQIMNSLGMISMVLNTFVRVKTSNERIREVFDAEAEEPAKNQTRSLQTDAHITFGGVGFEYKGSTGQAALSGLDFSVARGETLGVIGPTGSGKSTLAALLMRFYGVSSGEIRISGTPINAIPERELRAKTAIVPQTASLFTGTIRENILWGDADATPAQTEEAARAAEAHGFISEAPDGYDTVIGQQGVNLSGGQKQRLSIARALVRRPEILVLDDCTSALDVMTEAKVKRALKRVSGDMTCVLITQRVSAVMTCDKILVLENGYRAGFGTHGELMDSCEVYRDIYMSQIGKD